MSLYNQLSRLARLGCLALPLAFAGPLQAEPTSESPIGDVDFEISCSEAAQADFDRALAMMHHMMYVQARGMFEEMTNEHPDCAMGYWGVATTLFQPLWGTRPSEEERQRGWQLSEKALERVDSERERYLVEATGAFFRDPGKEGLWERLDRWVEAMETAYEAYPENSEMAAFYGLARLTGAQQAEDREPLYDEAEEVLRRVYEDIPTHPGAIHYSIHATDVDGRARNALDLVEQYGEIAPDVPHALHMPSHIYVRLGDWPKVIEWNRRSADAVLEQDNGESTSFHYIHAMDYLVYAHLQRGEDQRAQAAYEEAMEIDRHQAGFPGAFHIAAMPARLAIEQRQWDRAAALEARSPDYMPWDAATWAEGLTWCARGLGAVHTDQMDAAKQAEQRLAELRDNASQADDEAFANYIEIDRLILEGWIAHTNDNEERALELMNEAIKLEAAVEKHPVTPGALLPPNEALGELLMALDRPGEALEAFESAQAVWPGRYHTLLGAARAAAASGDEEKARDYYTQLREITGDTEREGVLEARRFLEGEGFEVTAY